MEEIKGDLIALAKAGAFDVITHGCNCFNTMKAGIAVAMAQNFGCDKFDLEKTGKGNIDKLGRIDFQALRRYNFTLPPFLKNALTYPEYEESEQILYVVNSYIEYDYREPGDKVRYNALALCMEKINHIFRGKHLGIPLIGGGLAKGNWDKISKIIDNKMTDCKVTLVRYAP